MNLDRGRGRERIGHPPQGDGRSGPLAEGISRLGRSRDMEDIVTVIDGRPEIITEIESVSESLKSYLVACCSGLLKERNFLDALPGHLLPDAASQSRSVVVIDRLKTIARS